MLEITDVRTVLGISYPTALALAKSTGEMVGGKWFIPADVIEARIAEERQRVDKMAERFNLALSVKIATPPGANAGR